MRRPRGSARYGWRFPFIVLAATVAVACGGDSSSGPNPSPVGAFQLSTLNGKGLPTMVFQDTGFMDVVTGGSLKLAGDGTYLSTISVDETVEGHLSTYVDSGSGKWTQSGATMEFIGVDSVRQAATWDGTSITLSDTTARPIWTMVFIRR